MPDNQSLKLQDAGKPGLFEQRRSRYQASVKELEAKLARAGETDNLQPLQQELSRKLPKLPHNTAPRAFWSLVDKFGVRRFNEALETVDSFLSGARLELLVFEEANPAVQSVSQCYSIRKNSTVSVSGLDIGRLKRGSVVLLCGWGSLDSLFAVYASGVENAPICQMIGSFRSPTRLDTGSIFAEVFGREFLKIARLAERVTQLRDEQTARSQLSLAKDQLKRLSNLETLWNQVCIPENQKSQLLTYCELFEQGDPAAPLGLLLYGPPGTGKPQSRKRSPKRSGANSNPSVCRI